MSHRIITFNDFLSGKFGPEFQQSARCSVEQAASTEDTAYGGEEVFVQLDYFDVRAKRVNGTKHNLDLAVYADDKKEAEAPSHGKGEGGSKSLGQATNSGNDDDWKSVSQHATSPEGSSAVLAVSRKRKGGSAPDRGDDGRKKAKAAPDERTLRAQRHAGVLTETTAAGLTHGPSEAASVIRVPAGWVVQPELHDGETKNVFKYLVSIFNDDEESKAYKGAWYTGDDVLDGTVVQKASIADAFQSWTEDFDVQLADGSLDATPTVQQVHEQIGVARRLARRPWELEYELQMAEQQDLSPLLSYKQHLRKQTGAPTCPQAFYHDAVLALTALDGHPHPTPLPAWDPALAPIKPVWVGAALRPLQAVGLLNDSPSVASVRFVVKVPSFKTAKVGECFVSEEIVISNICAPDDAAADRATRSVTGMRLIVRHSDLLDPNACSARMDIRSNGPVVVRCSALRVGMVQNDLARMRSDLFRELENFWGGESAEGPCLLDVKACNKVFDVRSDGVAVWTTIIDRVTAERDYVMADGSVVYWGHVDFVPCSPLS